MNTIPTIQTVYFLSDKELEGRHLTNQIVTARLIPIVSNGANLIAVEPNPKPQITSERQLVISVPKYAFDFLQVVLTILGSGSVTLGIDVLSNGAPINYWQNLLVIFSLGLGTVLVICALLLEWYEKYKLH